MQVRREASQRKKDTTTIHFTNELNAQTWLQASLAMESLLPQPELSVTGKKVYPDLIFYETINNKTTPLIAWELKPNVVTYDHVLDKIMRQYAAALPLNFGNPPSYFLYFIGSEIEDKAEYYLQDFNNLKMRFPTKSGVLKEVIVGFKTYQEVLTEYINKHPVSDRQIKDIRGSYCRLCGHSKKMPWIG